MAATVADATASFAAFRSHAVRLCDMSGKGAIKLHLRKSAVRWDVYSTLEGCIYISRLS